MKIIPLVAIACCYFTRLYGWDNPNAIFIKPFGPSKTTGIASSGDWLPLMLKKVEKVCGNFHKSSDYRIAQAHGICSSILDEAGSKITQLTSLVRNIGNCTVPFNAQNAGFCEYYTRMIAHLTADLHNEVACFQLKLLVGN
jgi:hypothetical protein